jgi:hypothetical protein
MERRMNNLPSIIPRKNLSHYWTYLDSDKKPIAIVARYDEEGKKKSFHQYRVDESGCWVEGAPTPLPIFGIDSLTTNHFEGFVYIFEGEKCAQAAHWLGLSALTSMMGSSQGHLADWAILASYRHVKKFILVPDNDDPGKKYMQLVYDELKKACPNANIIVSALPINNKGNDFIDWLKVQSSCPLDWDEFAPLDEPYCDYLKGAFEKTISESSISAEDFFARISSCPVVFNNEPEPIEEILSEVLPCPAQTLPKIITDWMQGIADQMQISIDFLAVPFIVYTGSLIGRKRGLELRLNSGWVEFPNLWGMLIGRPSVMKSPAMETTIKPLTTLAGNALKNFEAESKMYKFKLDAWKIRKKGAEEVYKKAFKESLDDKTKLPLEFSSEELPEEPKRKRYKTDDPTIEKLGEILIENPQGILLYRDELSGWLRSFEKNGRENDRQFFLESWSGKKDFDVDRISRGSLHVPSLFLSIFGSIQPGPLSQYVRSTIKGGIGDDGFLQRFSMMVWPDVKSDWKLVEGINIKSEESEVIRIFEYLDKLAFDDEDNPIILNFTDEAQKAFDEWQKELELRLRAGSLSNHMEAHLAKYKKLLPALCLIHEHLKKTASGNYPEIITLDTLKSSLLWVEYLESHALRIYESGANAIPKAAIELLRHIKGGDIVEPFSLRDVYYGHHWSGLTTSEEVEEVLDYLIDKGYLGCAMIRTNGRPTQKYWVHPKIFEE